MKLYMFRTVRLSIITSLFTVHSAIVSVIQVCRQFSSKIRMELYGVPAWSCSKAVYRSVWHIPMLSVQWINSWWWTEELSETCRVSWQNKFVKLAHLVFFYYYKETFSYVPSVVTPCSSMLILLAKTHHQRCCNTLPRTRKYPIKYFVF